MNAVDAGVAAGLALQVVRSDQVNHGFRMHGSDAHYS
jgi:gamma-glutamyltranspeptidase